MANGLDCRLTVPTTLGRPSSPPLGTPVPLQLVAYSCGLLSVDLGILLSRVACCFGATWSSR